MLREEMDSRSRSTHSIPRFSVVLAGRPVYHHYQDFTAGMASGTFQTAGMVIVPCSMSTLFPVAEWDHDQFDQRALPMFISRNGAGSSGSYAELL